MSPLISRVNRSFLDFKLGLSIVRLAIMCLYFLSSFSLVTFPFILPDLPGSALHVCRCIRVFIKRKISYARLRFLQVFPWRWDHDEGAKLQNAETAQLGFSRDSSRMSLRRECEKKKKKRRKKKRENHTIRTCVRLTVRCVASRLQQFNVEH